VSETLGYIVIESGRYTLPDGTVLEAGIVASENTKALGSVAFHDKFNKVPVVITAVSGADDETVPSRPQNITEDGFQIRVQQRIPDQLLQGTDTIAYIAWEPSSGTVDNLTFEVSKMEQVPRHQFQNMPFAEPFANLPVLLADVQMAKGEDVLNVRWGSKDFHSAEIIIDEEQDRDLDLGESAVDVGYIVIR
jgi:hypothetical protein